VALSGALRACVGSMDVEVQEEADQRQPLYLRLTLDVTRDECFVKG
jgi:hypothetical protein